MVISRCRFGNWTKCLEDEYEWTEVNNDKGRAGNVRSLYRNKRQGGLVSNKE